MVPGLGLSAQDLAGGRPKRVGVIGPGWYGKCDLFRLMQVTPTEVVSLCDVDKEMVSKAADAVQERQKGGKRPRTYGDYREMLKEKDLDIVLVATPDHWHALATIEAIKAGAHVYCQKPISVDITEGAAMLAAARKYNRVVQIGTQRRSTPHLVEAREKYIKSGRIGKIGFVETYSYSNGGGRSQTPPDAPPPETLDWEMWTGPAPMLPYNKQKHPGGWRNWMEYGNGTVGDMGVHMIDMVRWMMDLGWPTRISSSGGIMVNTTARTNIADTQVATYEFPDVKLIWQHRRYSLPPDPNYTWGATFYGEKGILRASIFRYDFQAVGSKEVEHADVTYELDKYPEDNTEPRLEKHCAPAIRYHMLDMLKAIATNGKPVADIEQGHISSACCILANMSMKTGRTLEYDPKTHTVKGDAEATRLLTRAYRAPWVHPDPKKV